MKPLPHNEHAERVMLAGLLREPLANASVFDLVSAADLYVYAHQLVYAACRELFFALEDVTPANVYAALRVKRQLDELPTPRPAVYLWELHECDPTGASCRHAAEQVMVLSLRRQVIGRAREMAAQARRGNLTPGECMELLR